MKFPTYNIHLDHAPKDRFTEVITDMKPQITKMINEYEHLTPGFIRNFFKDNEQVIKLRHMQEYEEIVSMAGLLGMDTYMLLMLNYAFELKQALCTSIVARAPDGRILHGRNMDFGFADAVRNATYIARFHKNGKYIFESVMFGGYVGVASGYRPDAYSLTLNARGGGDLQGVEKYFDIMARVYIGLPEIGVATRNAFTECDTYECIFDTLSNMDTVVPMYLIMADAKDTQAVVVSKDGEGIANIRYVNSSSPNWYLVQTNDDHFAGVCQQRCQDGIAHMDAIGAENINFDNLLSQVMVIEHTMNVHTIYTTMSSPSEGIFKAYGFNLDYPYVHAANPMDVEELMIVQE